jgi:hypothetical protein
MQFDLFYLNQESTINSLIYDYQDPEFGFWAGNINSQGIKALEGSHVAVQWPWLIFQNYQGNIGYTSFELIDDPPSPPKNPLDGFWMKVNPFNTKSPAMDRSKLAVVPLSRNYTFIDCSMWALVYQDRNGQLRAQPNDGNAAGKVTEEEWKEINNRTDDIVELWSESKYNITFVVWLTFSPLSSISIDQVARSCVLYSILCCTRLEPSQRRCRCNHPLPRRFKRYQAGQNKRQRLGGVITGSIQGCRKGHGYCPHSAGDLEFAIHAER